MAKYRKRPAVVDAFQMTEARSTNNSDWPEWLNKAWNKEPAEGALWIDRQQSKRAFVIGTLEGVQKMQWNDWIIRGVKGEIYACKPDIFAMTYLPADGGPDDAELARLRERVKKLEAMASRYATLDTINARLCSVVLVARTFDFNREWCEEHGVNDHMITMDHKDEMSVSEFGIKLWAALAALDKLSKEESK